MILPKHKELSLAHNPHVGLYETVEQHYQGLTLDDDDWVDPEQKRLALLHQEVWELRWYPRTTVTFHIVLGYDLYAVLAKAMAMDRDG